MPSYFYHLKFELYPYPEPHTSSTKPPEIEKQIWLPPAGTRIFDTAAWPKHTPSKNTEEWTTNPPGGTNNPEQGYQAVNAETGGADQQVLGGTVVIDCGPSRATILDDSDSTSISSELKEALQRFRAARSFDSTPRDQHIAVSDWRYSEVSVEGMDMSSTGRTGRPSRGQSSASTEAPGHDLQSNTTESVGHVTKARFEPVNRKNTELGWGIVHLYRDGEETPGLGIAVGHHTAGEGMSRSGKEGALVEADEGDIDGEDDCTTLCVPAVPSFFTPSDFMGWVGPKTRDQVSHFRMVMTGRVNRYLVLMKFRKSIDAKKWIEEWDGKLFFDLEPETCHVMFIKSITFQTQDPSRPNTSFPEISHDPFTPSNSASNFLKPLPPTTNNLIELPTCPVCLERMDDTTGLLTIPCQHVFHCACLQKWRGTGCPVCRHTNRTLAAVSQPPLSSFTYDASNPPFGSGEASLCSVCDCTDDLWICLICGYVGCGRYKGGHAKEHWKESAHNFALEIETQHVWDYAGDVWVHRLIRDKGDSKVIELPSSRRPAGTGLGSAAPDREDMDMVPREKLEAIGMEYTHLLTSQLDSQRVYFEELVSRAVSKASAASASAASASARADEAISALAALRIEHERLRDEVVVGLEKDLAREKKRAEKSSDVARGFGKSLMEEKKVSEGLMERIGHVNSSMMKMSTELVEIKEENKELQETNRDLLFSITAQQKLKDMQGEEGVLEEGELEGGTVSLPPEKEKERKRKGKGKR